MIRPLPRGASYSETLAAVDQEFAIACGLFESSPHRQDADRLRQYLELMLDAMNGTVTTRDAADAILELAI